MAYEILLVVSDQLRNAKRYFISQFGYVKYIYSEDVLQRLAPCSERGLPGLARGTGR